jgi:hypothetical protein
LCFLKVLDGIQSCKVDEGACGVTKDDLSFESASRSVNELVGATVVKIIMVKR